MATNETKADRDWRLVVRHLHHSADLAHDLTAKQVDSLWAMADGFGRLSLNEIRQINSGWDWSHIRDSSPSAVLRMSEAIREFRRVAGLDPDGSAPPAPAPAEPAAPVSCDHSGFCSCSGRQTGPAAKRAPRAPRATVTAPVPAPAVAAPPAPPAPVPAVDPAILPRWFRRVCDETRSGICREPSTVKCFDRLWYVATDGHRLAMLPTDGGQPHTENSKIVGSLMSGMPKESNRIHTTVGDVLAWGQGSREGGQPVIGSLVGSDKDHKATTVGVNLALLCPMLRDLPRTAPLEIRISGPLDPIRVRCKTDGRILVVMPMRLDGTETVRPYQGPVNVPAPKAPAPAVVGIERLPGGSTIVTVPAEPSAPAPVPAPAPKPAPVRPELRCGCGICDEWRARQAVRRTRAA